LVEGTYKTYQYLRAHPFTQFAAVFTFALAITSLCDPFTAHWPSVITPTNVCIGAVVFAEVFFG
jgi:hypothetical protein